MSELLNSGKIGHYSHHKRKIGEPGDSYRVEVYKDVEHLLYGITKTFKGILVSNSGILSFGYTFIVNENTYRTIHNVYSVNSCRLLLIEKDNFKFKNRIRIFD